MRRLQLLFAIILIGTSVWAQEDLSEKYAESITQEDLKKHLLEISSDAYEGRESGYPGQTMCEQYMVEHYKRWGLPPVKGSYTQEFELSLNNPKKVTIKKEGEDFKFIEDYYYFPSAPDGMISGELYYSGYGIAHKKYTDINIFEVKNKLVLVWAGEPKNEEGKFKVSSSELPSDWSTDNKKKSSLVEEAGAKALIIIHPDYDIKKEQVRRYFDHNTMSLLNETKMDQEPAMPVFHVSEKAAQKLLGAKNMKKAKKALKKRKVKAMRGEQIEIEFARRSEILTSTNVMGYIEGKSKKDEVVIITAHYDHIGVDGERVYNGADDDGSGTVATMEIAQAFAIAKQQGDGPERSVMILNVSAEEKGLLGSQYYVENPILPLENTVANLNIDMIGRVDESHEGDDNYVYLIGADRLSQELHDVGEEVNKKYSNLDLDYTFNAEDDPNQFYYRSDHYNFAKNNVPAVFYFSGVHEDYHQPGDTEDKIMYPKLEKITRLIFHTAWELANREERIKLTN